MTWLADDDRFLDHETGPGHPETPRRLEAVRKGLAAAGLREHLRPLTIRPATDDEICLLHSREYIEELRRFCADGGGWLDADTHAGRASFDIACLAAGAILSAVDAVVSEPGENAFCAVRPPGHHACRARPMGFCLFNNVALGAAYAMARHGLTRVLIVDWDLHHGNGTEEFFYEDPRVLYVSTHQYPFWPGSGAAANSGRGAGEGFNINIPFDMGTSAETFVVTLREKLAPAAEKFRPELVLISCGFDAHIDDPLGYLRLTANDYGILTRMVCDIAAAHAKGRLVSALEGGYHLRALAESSAAHVKELIEAAKRRTPAN